MGSYWVGSPSIWCWRDHSAGRSARRTTPMPCGRRPSIAALTSSGARKASETVMLTLRTLQPSRVAMLAALAVGSVISSLSQRRPRDPAATGIMTMRRYRCLKSLEPAQRQRSLARTGASIDRERPTQATTGLCSPSQVPPVRSDAHRGR